MYMTDFEICQSYRQAKYPQGQISVLAQLNSCRPKQIVRVLNKNGYQCKVPIKNTIEFDDKKEKISREQLEEIKILFNTDMTDGEIAKRYNISAYYVSSLFKKFVNPVKTRKQVLTDMKRNTVLSMSKRGFSQAEICRKLGLTRGLVCYYVSHA